MNLSGRRSYLLCEIDSSHVQYVLTNAPLGILQHAKIQTAYYGRFEPKPSIAVNFWAASPAFLHSRKINQRYLSRS